MNLAVHVATATDSSVTPGGLLLFLVIALVVWLAARGSRASRRCERYGHAPDPTTVGTRGERCARCGARLR